MIVVAVISVVPQHNGDDFCLLLNDENEYDDVDDVGLLLSDLPLMVLLVVSGDKGREKNLVLVLLLCRLGLIELSKIFKMEKTIIL